ncbi:MAG: hypothetical protein ACXADF_14545 [Candidatus Thorarchaeota archaeon]
MNNHSKDEEEDTGGQVLPIVQVEPEKLKEIYLKLDTLNTDLSIEDIVTLLNDKCRVHGKRIGKPAIREVIRQTYILAERLYNDL